MLIKSRKKRWAIGGVAAVAVGGLIASQPASALLGVPPNAAITAVPNPALVNQTVTFDASGSTGDGVGGTIASYDWDLDGNGTFETPTGATPSVSTSYATPATITAAVRVTDSEGDTDTDSVVLIVHQPPVASFTVTPAVPRVGESVTFDGSGSADPDGPIAATDHDWDLDNDGAFDDAEGTVASRSFPAAGNYTVSLQVTDSNGAQDVETKVVRVNTDPQASFIFEPSTPKIGEQITFSSTSTDAEGPIAATAWDLDGDGAFNDTTGPTATHAYAAPGTHSVGVQVTDSDGVTATATRQVVVQANAPTATFQFSPRSPRSNDPVTFDGSASTAPPGETITSMRWDLNGDGAFDDATGSTAKMTYRTPGPHAVGLRVEASGGGTDIDTQVVAVQNRPPTASFQIAPRAPAAGNPVRLTATATDPDGTIADYAWDLDGDGVYDDATRRSVRLTFPDPGDATVGLRVQDAEGAVDELRKAISVRDPVLGLLTPFPVVRLAGAVRANGMTVIDRLTVQAPSGSTVTVRCRRGKSCPFHEHHETVIGSRARVPALARALEPGTRIDVFVTRAEKIGKFTRFRLRRDKAPKRIDRCLEGKSTHPIHCPRQ